MAVRPAIAGNTTRRNSVEVERDDAIRRDIQARDAETDDQPEIETLPGEGA